MISMDFLTGPREGMEFIDFQSADFYDKLSGFLESNINSANVLSKDSAEGILKIVEEFTGFRNVKIHFTETGNLAVNVAYFSPNHVFNSDMAEALLKPTQSSLYQWFTQNKEKVFKGSVNYRTGKVEGAFRDVPIDLYINVNLDASFPAEHRDKYGVPIHGLLAGGIAHEKGHCFGACALMATAVKDNFLAKAALTFYKTRTNIEDRVVVLQDMNSLLDLKPAKQSELQALAQDEDESTAIMYFNKLVVQRNQTRALSLGVETMSSEVMADAYAIRMGCDKAILAAIGTFVDKGCIQVVMESFMAACFYTLFAGAMLLPIVLEMIVAGAPLAILLITGVFTFGIAMILDYFFKGYSGIYNAGHRRFEDAMRQMIHKLKEVKMDSKEKAQLLQDLEKFIQINKTLRPWYDQTITHRFYGWLFNGRDFKRQEVEHYTQALANNEMNVLAEKLKTLA